MRDSDKQKVYNGETSLSFIFKQQNPDRPLMCEVAGTKIVFPQERKFASVESIQTYVDRVLALPTIKAEFSPRPVQVRQKRGHREACYYCGTINIPMGDMGQSRWACRELVVLHELAHHLSSGDGHGSRFRNAMLKLLEIVMSPEVAFALRVFWYEQGIS